MMPKYTGPDGVLLVDKPSGPTSHDVVNAVRRHFGVKKVGHCGTLDPNATGLLILVLGKATKLSDSLMGQDKVYEGVITLGKETSSFDVDGDILSETPVPPLSCEELTTIALDFKGDQMQTPPMVSAIKKDGVPLYKLARKGIEVERPPRLIHVYYFKITQFQTPDCEFEIACTKGTYIRSIAHDLGQKIGCGAHLKTLRRTVSGSFNVRKAYRLERILEMEIADLSKALIPLDQLRESTLTG